MRYTPFLDSVGISFKEDVPDSVVNVLDSCLHEISRKIDWGEYKGKRRKPCHEQPMLLAGQPLGQYHCPFCMCMNVAGLPHLPPDAVGGDPENDKWEDYTGREWPAGYYSEGEENVVEAEVVDG